MAGAQLQRQATGHYLLNGELSFATATELLTLGRVQFAGQLSVDVDLSGVTHADSAGLALLLEWLRWARQQGQQLRYHAAPAQLHALASISEVEDLLADRA